MFSNYFKIAWRNLLRNKGFSAINILGLAIGMGSAILILLWIQNEVSYDRFHEKSDRIYWAWNRAEMNGETGSWAQTPKVLAKTLQRDFPEIEEACRANNIGATLLSVGEKRLTAEACIADSNFLRIFSFPLVAGNTTTVLTDMHNIVLTQTLAKRIFGNEEAVGKIIRLNNQDNFTVSGVLKDLPNNTTFNFEALISWSYGHSKGWDDEAWGNNSTSTYVLLKPNASEDAVAPKLKTLRQRYDKDDPNGGFFLYPINRWRLHSNFTGKGEEEGGRITIVKLFALVAAFILLIACINFMNLSTARSEKRAKEVGIRKVVGANKAALVGQFIGESILISLLAGAIALLLVQVSLPAFNSLTDKRLFVAYNSPVFWACAIGFLLFTGLLAGSYPAFFLSAMQPVRVLKGAFKYSTVSVSPRKVLVVLQFTFAITLIIATLIVKQQIVYAQNRESGYNKANLIYTGLTDDLQKNYTLLKTELLSSGTAVSVTKTSSPITESWSNTWGFEWPGKDPNDKTIFDRFIADDAIAKTAGLKMAQGRDIDLANYPTDSTAVLLNETAVKKMGFKNPIGQMVKENDIDWHVVGVIKDFVLTSPFGGRYPLVIQGGEKLWFNIVHVKLNPQNSTAANLKAAELIFKKYNPAYPFDYKFADEEYARKFDDTKRTGTLAALFAVLTIFISCLGLFGLAAYTAQNRIKEIGIRKVLGASVSGIALLLSKDFLKLVLIALLVASPVAWWSMNKWLQTYEYHTTISWWVFATAGAGAVAIAILTVGAQALKGANANPVKSLRTE